MMKPEAVSGSREVTIDAKINGSSVHVIVPSKFTLAELLREKLDLTGTKLGCNRAECGVCTVLLDGTPVFSCTVLAAEVNGRKVETVEGMLQGERLHPLQQAFVKEDALQCGFCTPGLLMTLEALTNKVERPTLQQVKDAIAGNYCRCGAYPNIFKAALEAAQAR
ncbi:MAG TPA: (2Fe-2S)-binding protein [Nitrososphaerales archaeon]|nr:(2Fe-2S)-binding protein [Nitrososphaerales archaeon]